ncbi:MAG TPA: HEPN domain-containing protein [Thermoanaerobaculia bacterium]|nr:HEPN domain-containing protein [Thermoanaerobaculia bacterium]
MNERARREGARWLAAADEDLALARHAAAGGFHAGACFHAQQAAEKALKAIHFARGARAVLGHSVRKLIDALETGELEDLKDAARELDLLYIPSRYPNGLDAGTPADAFGEAQSSRAIAHAQAILSRAGGLSG